MDNCGIGTLLKDFKLHVEIIHFLFNLLTHHGLHLKLSKSIFMQPQMDFLGVWISKEGATVDPAKVARLRDYPCKLKDKQQVHGFLEVAGYHRMFCPNFSIITCYSSFNLSSIYAVKYHLTMRIHLYQLSFLISMIPSPLYHFPTLSDLPII